jgi:hypothetical protein
VVESLLAAASTAEGTARRTLLQTLAAIARMPAGPAAFQLSQQLPALVHLLQPCGVEGSGLSKSCVVLERVFSRDAESLVMLVTHPGEAQGGTW